MKKTRKIVFMNQKGGVGKTTCCINIAEGLKRKGWKVGVIDLDPQAHLTYGLGIPAHELEYTAFELLDPNNTEKKPSIEEVILDRDGLKVIPSFIKLSKLELQPGGSAGEEYFLAQRTLGRNFEKLYSLDVILVDSPPSLGTLSLNALSYANEVYTVSQPEFLSLHGIRDLLYTIDMVRKRINRSVKISGVIINRFDGRKRLSREVLTALKEKFPDQMFHTAIRENIALAESVSYGKTIFEYSPKSHGAEDFRTLTQEILERWKNG